MSELTLRRVRLRNLALSYFVSLLEYGSTGAMSVPRSTPEHHSRVLANPLKSPRTTGISSCCNCHPSSKARFGRMLRWSAPSSTGDAHALAPVVELSPPKDLALPRHHRTLNNLLLTLSALGPKTNIGPEAHNVSSPTFKLSGGRARCRNPKFKPPPQSS